MRKTITYIWNLFYHNISLNHSITNSTTMKKFLQNEVFVLFNKYMLSYHTICKVYFNEIKHFVQFLLLDNIELIGLSKNCKFILDLNFIILVSEEKKTLHTKSLIQTNMSTVASILCFSIQGNCVYKQYTIHNNKKYFILLTVCNLANTVAIKF